MNMLLPGQMAQPGMPSQQGMQPPGPMGPAGPSMPQGPQGQQGAGNQLLPTNLMGTSPLSQQQLNDAMAHNSQWGTDLSNLLGNPNLSSKDALASLSDAMGRGAISPQNAASEAAQMPTDPAALRSYLTAHYLQNMQTGRQLVDHQRQFFGTQPAAGTGPMSPGGGVPTADGGSRGPGGVMLEAQ